jgi:hypothetical protein
MGQYNLPMPVKNINPGQTVTTQKLERARDLRLRRWTELVRVMEA